MNTPDRVRWPGDHHRGYTVVARYASQRRGTLLLLARSTLLALFTVGVALLSSNSFAAESVGRLADMTGEVSFREASQLPYKAATKGAAVEKGYWIKTGDTGWAIVALNDGSRLTLANQTELEITELLIGKNRKDGVFSMTQGKLRASVTRLVGERVDYRVKSPTAVAGIKGTEFMMMTRGLANVFFGNEGVADISGDTTPVQPLHANTMVQNTRGLRPADPVQVEPGTPLHKARQDFEAITGATPPTEWERAGNLPNIIARWNINYGHFLADAGRYEEALYVFQIALDLTDLQDIRSDARLERGAVYARLLKNPEAALGEYLVILEEFPRVAQRETALYLVGLTLHEMGLTAQARERLMQYKKEYPGGRHIGNVETILGAIKR